MGNSEDKIEVTLSDLQMIREVAVLTASMERTDKLIPEIFSSLKSISNDVSAIPMDIVKCKSEHGEELRTYMHDQFVTVVALELFESKIEKKMSRSTWTISGMIIMASAFGWMVTNTTIFGG